MNLSIRFPNISAYFEGWISRLRFSDLRSQYMGYWLRLECFSDLRLSCFRSESIKKIRISIWEWYLSRWSAGWSVRDCIILHFRGSLSAESRGQISLISVGGGLAIYGGIFGGALAGFIYCKIRKVSFGQMADTVSIGLLTGQIIGVWGNAFNREAFGEYTDSLFAMQIPLESVHSSAVDQTDAGQSGVWYVDETLLYRYTRCFFYESIWCLLLLIVLLILGRRKVSGRNLPVLSCRIWTGQMWNRMAPYRQPVYSGN